MLRWNRNKVKAFFVLKPLFLTHCFSVLLICVFFFYFSGVYILILSTLRTNTQVSIVMYTILMLLVHSFEYIYDCKIVCHPVNKALHHRLYNIYCVYYNMFNTFIIRTIKNI